MLDPSRYKFCSEFYFVEKTVEVVVQIGQESETIRIEAHKKHGGRYSTRSFIQRHIPVQPTYPQRNGQFVQKPESTVVWAAYDLPWTDRESADDALAQALGFLGERCKKWR